MNPNNNSVEFLLNEIQKLKEENILLKEKANSTVVKSEFKENEERSNAIIHNSSDELGILVNNKTLLNGDLSQRNQSEKDLVWSQYLLEMMANSSPLGYLVVDNRTDEILYFNRRFCEIWGILNLEERMRKGELKNNDIIPHCLPVLVDIPAFAESCKPLQDENNRIVVSDEISFSLNRTIHRFTTQIRGRNDEYFGRFYIFEDITDRKKVQEELKIKNTELEELISTKDKFFSIIAHDLKSPFNGLLGLTEIISDNLIDLSMNELKEISANLQASAQNLYKLLDNLLEWSKIQRGMIEFNPKYFSLENIIKQNIEIQSEVAKQKNISLFTKDIVDKVIFADVSMLNATIRNLISNSIKFTNRGGTVEIGFVDKFNEFELYVKDNGIGISEETLTKLFRIDHKVSRKGTEKEDSTGLGLLLCKEFIDLHNGKIWAESEVGKGSTFFISIPKQLNLN